MIGLGPRNSQKLYAKREYSRDNLSSISATSRHETFCTKSTFLMIDNIQYSLTQYILAYFHPLLQCLYHFLSTRVL